MPAYTTWPRFQRGRRIHVNVDTIAFPFALIQLSVGFTCICASRIGIRL